MNEESNKSYYVHIAAAFARGKLEEPNLAFDDFNEIRAVCAPHGLKLHKFKKTHLPRVKKVLGILKGLAPDSLLDIGSGRGAFLWPLLTDFPDLQVMATDILPHRVDDILAINKGGIDAVQSRAVSVTNLNFDNNSFDVATALEVLEHLENSLLACKQLVRVAKRFVVVSVPSKADNNPEHIQLFTGKSLTDMFVCAGATSVSVEYITNHIVAIVKV